MAAMKLHRADDLPDWEPVAAEKRTAWQRLAANTQGVVTPGNATSVVGFGFVAAGLWYLSQDRVLAGLITITIGRLLDIADGAIADRTGTKSPLGESVDAALDKLAIFGALIVGTAVGILPLPIAVLIGIEGAVVAGISLAAHSLRRRIHPERIGKLGTAVSWAALMLFVVHALADGGLASASLALGYVLAIVAILMNGYASVRYAQTFYSQRQREQR
jgi:phosphatidylglycerophosphate synthase